MRIRTIALSGLYVVQLVVSLGSLWIELDWKVRKTRRAFEKELTKQGMKKEDARRISAQFPELKHELMRSLRAFPSRRR